MKKELLENLTTITLKCKLETLRKARRKARSDSSWSFEDSIVREMDDITEVLKKRH